MIAALWSLEAVACLLLLGLAVGVFNLYRGIVGYLRLRRESRAKYFVLAGTTVTVDFPLPPGWDHQGSRAVPPYPVAPREIVGRESFEEFIAVECAHVIPEPEA